MEVEVMPSPAVDFNFDSACTSPYISAPSSPHHFGTFFSAPTSPTRASSFLRDFDTFSVGDATTSGGSLPSTIPFSWEEKPGTPKTKDAVGGTDFEFDFRGYLHRDSLSLSAADELFDGGKIKTLKPPPRLQFSENELIDSPKSPRSSIGTKFLMDAMSPKPTKKDIDPFEAAIEQTRRENYSNQQQSSERGRERTYDSSNSSRRQKGTRSLSPFRVCDIFSETNQQTSSSSNSSKNLGWKGYKKWKLKDFLLFRSASEGRATSKDSLKKYSLLKQSNTEEVKNSSFRLTESSGSVSRRRGSGGPVSAHGLHYTANRAVSEEVRRKTFLPYNHGLLGCLGFNPAVHDISRGIRSMTRR